jgi:hypothetical protein
MAKLSISFRRILLNSEEIDKPAQFKERMFSRIFFDLEFIPGHASSMGMTVREMHADVSQPLGADYADYWLDVHAPEGGVIEHPPNAEPGDRSYDGLLPHEAFSAAVESRFRQNIKSIYTMNNYGWLAIAANVKVDLQGTPLELEVPDGLMGGMELDSYPIRRTKGVGIVPLGESKIPESQDQFSANRVQGDQ